MRIKSLQLRARAAVEGFIKGIHRSTYHGFSVEFSEYRQYTPGDDPRYLDWRLFARTDRYYVKRFEDETNLRCHIVLDTSRSMNYRSLDYSKSEYARTAAATIAYFLTLQRDAVGLLTFEDRITDYLPPRHRPGHLRRLLAMLDREPGGRATDLAGPLEEIAATVKKRGLIVLLSDLLAPADALRSRLGYLRSRGHEVIVLRILDPAELAFTFATPAMFQDLESGRELYIDPDAARAGYLSRFADTRRRGRARLHRPGDRLPVDHHGLPAGADPLQLLEGEAPAGRQAGPARGGRRVAGGVPMSFLTPLYLLGALAVAAPIVFHLIRRTTKGEVPFSSLIFLSPSPPRLTRRSRLDHWLLLLLRAAALILLTVAFARPFLRQAAGMSLGDAEQRRIAVLIDTSASMRRGDLWAQRRPGPSRPSRRAAPAINWPFSRLTVPRAPCSVSTSPRRSTRRGGRPWRRRSCERLTPGWGATHLGQALVDAAGAIENVGDAGSKSSSVRRRIVLISDLQQGSRLDALGDFEWPSDVELDLKTVATEGSNAGLQWLAGPDTDEPVDEGAKDLRVRVSNDATSKKESFELAWTDDKAPPIPAYVPPGESRVVRVPPTRRLRTEAIASAPGGHGGI